MTWPPIIAAGRAPWPVRVRDTLLTLLAWAALLYLVRDGIALLVDYFGDPIFELTKFHPHDWLHVWNRLDDFMLIAAAVMLWLAIWGIIHRRRLRLVARATPPPVLPPEEHAADFHLDASALERLRESKIAVVEFDQANRIAAVTPGGPRGGGK